MAWCARLEVRLTYGWPLGRFCSQRAEDRHWLQAVELLVGVLRLLAAVLESRVLGGVYLAGSVVAHGLRWVLLLLAERGVGRLR